MTAKISDLSVDDFRILVQETVTQTLVELFGDPDQGLELRDEIVARLSHSLATEDERPAVEDVVAELGLEW